MGDSRSACAQRLWQGLALLHSARAKLHLYMGGTRTHQHVQKKFGKQGKVVFNSDLANLGRKGGALFLHMFNWKCLKVDRFSSQWECLG